MQKVDADGAMAALDSLLKSAIWLLAGKHCRLYMVSLVLTLHGPVYCVLKTWVYLTVSQTGSSQRISGASVVLKC